MIYHLITINKYLLTTLAIIAHKYDCKIEKVESNNIYLVGPKENQVQCAIEIEYVLGSYLV